MDYGANPYDEQEIASSNLTSVLVRTLKGKPKLESIAISTWIAANAKIMDRLIASDRLKTINDISNYLSYTVKIGELIETFTWVSVLQYDNEYRKLQFEYGFRWGSDSQQLHSRFLKQRVSLHHKIEAIKLQLEPIPIVGPRQNQEKYAISLILPQAAHGQIAIFSINVTSLGALRPPSIFNTNTPNYLQN